MKRSRLAGNVIDAAGAKAALSCIARDGFIPATNDNDVFNSAGPAEGGDCAAMIGTNGNFSAEPKLGTHGRPTSRSPLIDAGFPSAPHLPATDFAGNPRAIDGNRDGSVVVDIGAYELQ